MTSRAEKRIFFALWPSEQQRRQIATSIDPHKAGLRARWTARENWHVTLVFIGDFPGKDIRPLQDAAARVRCPPMVIRFERIDYWKRPKIVCLSGPFVPDGLADLVKSLESEASAFGYQPENRPYKPHMTIARKARFFDPIPLAQPLELQWSGFELIESVATPQGVRYQPLKQ